uniref:DM domain-containing protein n=1 Tax=Caenorhabditis japonica TaxID=281687 RepID=A0A8R1HST6_CAEJA
MPRPRKNHKCECPYADCNCEKCGLVEKRRILNLQLQIYNSEGDLEKKSDDDEDRKSKGERVPNCQKCGQHGRKSRLKGHKRNCPFRECACAKCAVVTERQKLMADQIKIRRRQRKDTLMNLTREHITSTINAAAALSANPINFNQLNAFLYGSIKTSPQPLLPSPTSSDASSYSPSLQFPSPPLPILIPSSADQFPTSQTPITMPVSAASLVAQVPVSVPVPITPTGFPFQGQDAATLLQTILEQYRLLEESSNNSNSSSPSKDEESGDEEAESLNSNCIIDVCTV